MNREAPPLRRPLLARMRSWWGRYHLPVLFVAGLATTWIGVTGFRAYAGSGVPDRSFPGALYLSLQLFGMESGGLPPPLPWQLQVARFLAPLITISALLSGLAQIFDSEIREFWLDFYRGHTVLCGLGRRSVCLLREEIAAGRKTVVIERNPENRFLPFCEEFGVHVIEGDASDPAMLRAAALERAKRLLVCTGSDNENLEIAATAIGILSHEGKGGGDDQIELLMHVVDRRTRELFQKQEVFSQATKRINMRPFDVYENGARRLWRNQLSEVVRGVGADEHFHLVVVGLGQMGVAVVCEVSRHLGCGGPGHARLSVIDLQARRLAGRLELKDFDGGGGDLPWVDWVDWVDGDLDDPGTLDLIAAICAEPGVRPAIALCMDADYENVTHALRLASRIGNLLVPIFIRLAEAEGLSRVFDAENSDSALAKQIGTFGLLRDCVEFEKEESP